MAKATNKTAQATSYYQEFACAHKMANYHYMDCAVYRDGGTVKYQNKETDEQTYSVSLAKKWYLAGVMVWLTRDCQQTIFAVLNPSKSLTRKCKGNGKIKYYRAKRGDAFPE